MTTTIHGVYQAATIGEPIREAFAIFESDTIMGYSIVRACGYKRTGQTSFGPAANAASVCLEAEGQVNGQFTTAIEPNGAKWTLTAYERGSITPIHESSHDTSNCAMLAGRTYLENRIKVESKLNEVMEGAE